MPMSLSSVTLGATQDPLDLSNNMEPVQDIEQEATPANYTETNPIPS